MLDKALKKSSVTSGKTHGLVAIISAEDKDDVYRKMNNVTAQISGMIDQARKRDKYMYHTSMSIGDCAQDPAGKMYQCDWVGWKTVR
jgi:hypothetical protein